MVGACAAKTSQAGDSDAMGTEPASAQADTPPDIMATLLAMVDVGKEVASASPAVDEPSSGQQEQATPQNVVLSADGIQVVPAQQINGRMPDSAVIHAADEKAGAAQTAGTAAAGELFRGQAVVMPEMAGISADLYNAPTPAIQQDATGPDQVRNVLQETPVASFNVVSASLEPEQSVMAEPANTFVDSVSRQTEAVPARSLARPTLDAYFQTSVAPSNNSMASTAPAGQEMSPLPIVDAVTHDTDATLAGRTLVDAKRNGLLVVQDAQSSKPDAADTVNSAESRSGNVVAAAIKNVMAPASGESFGQDGKGASDQKTGAQDNMTLLHQLKVESAPVAAGTSGSSTSEPVRTNVMEQVISQVREHLAGREIKSGVEQITIRLSPENLGELKLNLRMENQCLKVEIVAENSTVRDALIKHSDTLKDTLARQNISMETFDVSTGSNGNGSTSYGKGDWRELARQQQQNMAWNFSGGYRAGDSLENAQSPIYQAPSEHSMLDVHF